MNIFSVSIAIPAYNEEVNIENLLRKLICQNKRTFGLKEISVYSDGSSDLTNTIVKKISKDNPVIRLYASKIRRGKIYQLNQSIPAKLALRIPCRESVKTVRFS